MDKASLFNEFFGSVFSTRALDSVSLHVDVVNPNLLMDVSTTRNEVKSILSQLDANKATGVDGIPARILKECADELSYPLARFYFFWSFELRRL